MNAKTEELLARRSVIICCGAGGVGKTTTAAALALFGAISGLRACVVTIDPAQRLADALGVDQVSNTPHRILGAYSGTLDALMLDAKATFDDLIDANAKDHEQAERIKSNRLYQNLASALSGTQEYMATEKLFELYESDAFDLIVVDTPPTRFALDFLSAPKRLAGFLDNKIFRLLVMPGRAYLRALSVATQMLLKTIGKVAGSEIVEDTVAFFQAFDGMEQGFKERAASVDRLLEGGKTGFVLVSSPDKEAVEQVRYLLEQLQKKDHGIDALIINKVEPDFGPVENQAHEQESAKDGPWSELVANLGELSARSRAEHRLLEEIGREIEPAPMICVPLLEVDVHDLSGLEIVVRHLAQSEVP